MYKNIAAVNEKTRLQQETWYYNLKNVYKIILLNHELNVYTYPLHDDDYVHDHERSLANLDALVLR
ncbi:hypothetical protein NIES4071_32590 [Calothrix sp. NIES-4071]|nr:hypothetical protein NIES4071_32590 [Calothrix sp. NIES-4071]BAZ57579.1 hypothetical protein NIES4105_32530 [Calothrix sp. NIES-4105]